MRMMSIVAVGPAAKDGKELGKASLPKRMVEAPKTDVDSIDSPAGRWM